MLLDLLHEDINQITTKPYIEYPVYTSFEKSQSGEMWSFHLCRNKSQIVDWFYGQSVTFVKCTECGEVGIGVFSTIATCSLRAVQFPHSSSSSRNDDNFRECHGREVFGELFA